MDMRGSGLVGLRAVGALAVASLAGLIHAASSLYWAAGGTALLDTVGQWALAWREREPRLTTLLLLAIGLGKVAAVGVPWLVLGRDEPVARVVRGVIRGGAVLLTLYGVLNMLGAWAVLAGLAGGTELDIAGLWGHAALWDPLFAVWGAALVIGFGVRERRDRGAQRPRTATVPGAP